MCQVPEQNMRMHNGGPKLLHLLLPHSIYGEVFYKVLATIQFLESFDFRERSNMSFLIVKNKTTQKQMCEPKELVKWRELWCSCNSIIYF